MWFLLYYTYIVHKFLRSVWLVKTVQGHNYWGFAFSLNIQEILESRLCYQAYTLGKYINTRLILYSIEILKKPLHTYLKSTRVKIKVIAP